MLMEFVGDAIGDFLWAFVTILTTAAIREAMDTKVDKPDRVGKRLGEMVLREPDVEALRRHRPLIPASRIDM